MFAKTNFHYQYPCQHKNIKTAIKIFESNIPNGDSKIFISGRKVVNHKEVLECELLVWGKISATSSLNLNHFLQVQGNSYHQFLSK